MNWNSRPIAEAEERDLDAAKLPFRVAIAVQWVFHALRPGGHAEVGLLRLCGAGHAKAKSARQQSSQLFKVVLPGFSPRRATIVVFRIARHARGDNRGASGNLRLRLPAHTTPREGMVSL